MRLAEASPAETPGASRTFLRALFDAAVAAADPMRCIPEWLPERPSGRVVVIGAGKASARMGEAVERAWGPCEGLILTRDGYARPLQGIEVALAAHPVPDGRGLQATRRMIELLEGCGEADFVLALISGGGSSLLTCPAGDITLEEEQEMTRALLSSGAPIAEMNTLRKHLSRAKGGNLAAAAWPARMLSLVVSDVPGDDPELIASGPTVADSTTPAQALEIARRWSIPLTPAMRAVLAGPPMTQPPGAPKLAHSETRIVAAPAQSLRAAAARAEEAGCRVEMLGDALEGEARDLAHAHAALALETRARLGPDAPPVLLLSGGECTVTRRGNGLGGPNAEYALALALALRGAPGISAIACDTDGVDGAAEVAGAIIDEATLSRAAALGIDPQAALAANDSHGFFAALGTQVVPGPTLTNVNDFRAILISGTAR
ncbi:glycerate kinase (plasmid) [Salipiger sp. H15]|uniref:Glycerate kinase n=1 Tax=Alloyangia sp. H15 TaxID=3029062 RepID=A0AAU8AR00_9RHOB